MLTSRTRWLVNEVCEEAAQQIAGQLQIPPLLARLLTVRGITQPEEAKIFMFGGQECFHDPFLFDGMKAAVERIEAARRQGEKVRVYGDYDADGVSSTALIVRLFQFLALDFDFYIPHRIHEGYGLNRVAIDRAKKNGVSLIVTVDNGISAVDEITYAKELGMDVIVTDHHEPPEKLPDALAIVNPKKPGCGYPFKALAGVGVALKLAQALVGMDVPKNWLQLAAVGTVADLMPLTGENRIIVKLGLESMKEHPLPGVQALLGIADIERREVNAEHIGFAMAPRINASGRLHSADAAAQLLITGSEQEAEHLAFDLDQLNNERQKIVEDMMQQALEKLDRIGGGKLPNVIILADSSWNVGVVGIVAAKLLERFYRPTLILTVDEETGLAKGSARSINGFDIFQALQACSDLLEHYGGHQAAAGMTLAVKHLDELDLRLNKLADDWLTSEDWIPLTRADLACDLEDVTLPMIEQLQQLAPFGMGNPSPRVMIQGIGIEEIRTMGKDQQHLKLMLSASREVSCAKEAVSFGKGQLADFISQAAKVDLVGELSVNEWNGSRKPQIMVQDLRVPQIQVFDLRGQKWTQDKLADFYERSLSICGGELSRHAVWVSDEADAAHLPEPLRQASLWLSREGCDPSGTKAEEGVIPLRPLGTRTSMLDNVQDLWLFSLPVDVDSIRQALGAFPQVQRIYAVFRPQGSPDQGFSLPSRESFKAVYAYVSQNSMNEASRNQRISRLSHRSGLSVPAIEFILRVFEELDFIQDEGTGWMLQPSKQKKELSTSGLYQRKMHQEAVERELIFSTTQQLTKWIHETRLESGTVKESKENII